MMNCCWLDRYILHKHEMNNLISLFALLHEAISHQQANFSIWTENMNLNIFILMLNFQNHQQKRTFHSKFDKAKVISENCNFPYTSRWFQPTHHRKQTIKHHNSSFYSANINTHTSYSIEHTHNQSVEIISMRCVGIFYKTKWKYSLK